MSCTPKIRIGWITKQCTSLLWSSFMASWLWELLPFWLLPRPPQISSYKLLPLFAMAMASPQMCPMFTSESQGCITGNSGACGSSMGYGNGCGWNAAAGNMQGMPGMQGFPMNSGCGMQTMQGMQGMQGQANQCGFAQGMCGWPSCNCGNWGNCSASPLLEIADMFC